MGTVPIGDQARERMSHLETLLATRDPLLQPDITTPQAEFVPGEMFCATAVTEYHPVAAPSIELSTTL